MSFSDLMSSGRGPGVIGMLLALVVLAGFGLLFLVAFDEGMQGKGKPLATTIAEQAKEIEDVQAKVESMTKRLEVVPGLGRIAAELAAVSDENQVRAERLKQVGMALGAIDEQIATLAEEWENYKTAYRTAIRDKAKGLKMDELKTRDGKVYTKVSVNKVTAQAMHVQHADGISAIPYEVLPAEMQDLYQFDPQEKNKLLAAERKATQEHVGAVEGSVKQAKDQAEQQRLAKAGADKLQRVQDIAALRKHILTLTRDITTQQQAIRLEKQKSLSHAPAMEIRLREMNAELSGLNAKLAQLEAQN
ncbi:MAG: hypothetical protein WCK77_12090 [Verrucomicrobiota bacterium]